MNWAASDLLPCQLVVDNGFRAEGTGADGGGTPEKLLQTFLVQRVSTPQHPNLRCRMEEIFQADWAIVMHSASNALVITAQLYCITTATG
jgi:hypothetical protein